MDAKSKLIEYAKKHNHNSDLSNEAFCGKMAAGGIVIDRQSNSRTTARATRQGTEIIVTETTVTETAKVVNGKMEFGKVENVVEVMRISL